MTLATETRSAYRSILREFARSSIHPSGRRNRAIARNIRVLFEERTKRSSLAEGSDKNALTRKDKLHRDVRNAATFLRSSRIHKELLDRYNPLHDLTDEEHLKATARRVGLNMPLEVKGDQSDDK